MSSSASQKSLHPRNLHNGLYDFDYLIQKLPELKHYLTTNPSGVTTIDFANPKAVLALNKALLLGYYKVNFWEIAPTNLCPPIPSRADYIHHIADLLAQGNEGEIPTGKNVLLLDIGTGASLVYPIIGASQYGWRFVGTDIDKQSIADAQGNIDNNPNIKSLISLRLQSNKRQILKGIIQAGEYYDVVICNPPFFRSKEEALGKTTQKLKNLGKAVDQKPVQNFSGQNNELWYPGGELAFVTNYIYESKHFAKQAIWFTCLISDKNHLKPLQTHLKKIGAKTTTIIPMQQGHKISRILCWQV